MIRISREIESLARVLSDLVGAKLRAKVSTEAPTHLAFAACTADVITWKEVTDPSQADRKQLRNRLSPCQVRIFRRLIKADQPRTQMPRPAKPQLPELETGETVDKDATLKSVRWNLTPPRAAATFSANLKFEAAAAEPPYAPYPAPNLIQEPWAPRNADVKRAIEADNATRKQFRVKKNSARQFPRGDGALPRNCGRGGYRRMGEIWRRGRSVAQFNIHHRAGTGAETGSRRKIPDGTKSRFTADCATPSEHKTD